MQLTDDELRAFEKDGYLFFPGRFTAAEAAALRAEADAVYALERDEVWRESSGAPRICMTGSISLGWAPRRRKPSL